MRCGSNDYDDMRSLGKYLDQKDLSYSFLGKSTNSMEYVV